MKKILLLGSGELGKEFVISAQRKGQYIIACDSYAGAPAMQVADECEVFSMLDGDALERVVRKHQPDIIVPEIEAIRTERLYDFEKEGSKNVLYLKGNFTVTGTMDGEVSTVKEAKLEISEECVFYDNRAEYQEKNDMNLKEFKEHISSNSKINSVSNDCSSHY